MLKLMFYGALAYSIYHWRAVLALLGTLWDRLPASPETFTIRFFGQ